MSVSFVKFDVSGFEEALFLPLFAAQLTQVCTFYLFLCGI